jgi:hypothetical protein
MGSGSGFGSRKLFPTRDIGESLQLAERHS